jgi:hypothetical protein
MAILPFFEMEKVFATKESGYASGGLGVIGGRP